MTKLQKVGNIGLYCNKTSSSALYGGYLTIAKMKKNNPSLPTESNDSASEPSSKNGLPLVLSLLLASACQPVQNFYTTNVYTLPTADTGDSGDTGAADPYEGTPEPTVEASDLDIALFDDGNTIDLVVTDEQVTAMNDEFIAGSESWYVYDTEEEATTLTIEDMFVTSALTGQVAQYGATGMKILGESSGMIIDPSSSTSIPCFRVNVDAVTEDASIDGYDNFILRSGMIGGLLREDFESTLLNTMGQAIPQTSFVNVRNNQLASGASVPYVMKQDYDGDYSRDFGSYYGGSIQGIWEMVGDFNGWWQEPECELSTCNEEAFVELEDRIGNFDPSTGSIIAATEDIVDWYSDVGILNDMCTSYLTGTGDDYYHNTNNVRWVLGSDSKFRLVKSSWDISFGQEWYPETELVGWSSLATYCQDDSVCWEELLNTCDATYVNYVNADPIALLEDRYATLQELGMERGPDAELLVEMEDWILERIENVPEELANYRECGPYYYGEPCDEGVVDTGWDTGM